MYRKLTVVSTVLWILGIAASIIGLNLEGNTGSWLSVGGNITFLLGLALQGVIWALKSKAQKQDGTPSDTPDHPDQAG